MFSSSPNNVQTKELSLENAALNITNNVSFEHFGQEIASEKNRLFISAPNFRDDDKKTGGKVYVYDIHPTPTLSS